MINVGYANLPCAYVKANDRNVLEDLCNTWPDVDIWLLCELYWTERYSTQCPIDYRMFTHDKFYKKHTMIVFKKELESRMTQRSSKLNETSAIHKGSPDIGLTVFYRSPTRDATIYKLVANYLHDPDVSKIPFYRYIDWMGNTIGRIFKKNNNATNFFDI